MSLNDKKINKIIKEYSNDYENPRKDGLELISPNEVLNILILIV